MENDAIKTRTGTFWMDEDGIIRFVCLPDVEWTLEDTQQVIAFGIQVGQGTKRPVLVDARQLKTWNRQTQTQFADEEAAKHTSALALLVNPSVNKMIGILFMAISRPPYPVRMFESEAKAVEWLKGFLA